MRPKLLRGRSEREKKNMNDLHYVQRCDYEVQRQTNNKKWNQKKLNMIFSTLIAGVDFIIITWCGFVRARAYTNPHIKN